MYNLLSILLMAPPQDGKSGGDYSFLIMMGLFIVVIYFFMIRPQSKKQKEIRKFRDGLKNGDKVITTGGIYGKIIEVREQAVILEVEDKMRLKVDKAALIQDSTDLEKK